MQKQKEIDLSKAILVLKENRKKIGISTGVVTLIAILYCIFATPIFTATALINPPKLSDAGTSFSQVISGLNALTGSGGGGILQKTDADIATVMLKTNAVKDMVIDKFNLVNKFKVKDIEKARKILDGKVKLIPDIRSGFIEIDVDDEDPKLAAAIANYYTIALGQLINNVAYSRANQRYQFYQQQLAHALISLNKAESDLKDFAKRNGIIAGQQVQVIANISMQLQTQLVVAQYQLESMRYYVNTDNPDYLALQTKINSIKTQLDKINNQTGGEDIAIPSGLAPELANQYLNLMRDFVFKELVYNVLLKQSKASQLDALSEVVPLSIQVIDPAQVPIYKSKPRRARLLFTAFTLSAFFSGLYFLFKNRNFITSNKS